MFDDDAHYPLIDCTVRGNLDCWEAEPGHTGDYCSAFVNSTRVCCHISGHAASKEDTNLKKLRRRRQGNLLKFFGVGRKDVHMNCECGREGGGGLVTGGNSPPPPRRSKLGLG